MIKGTYQIADTVFEIDSIYESVHTICAGYSSSETPAFTVKTTQADIDFEREKSKKEDIREGIPIRQFDDRYLETLAVYRKLCDILLRYDILLYHGSVVAVDGKGYLFTAKSGTGKSTHTRLWRDYFGARAVMINDDKPLIRITDTAVIVYGTPWNGKHHLSTNTSVPLKAICILNRGTKNEIHSISKQEAYPMLIQQTNRPADTAKMKTVLELIDKMCEHIGLYSLRCNMDPDAASTAFSGMNTEEIK